MAVIGDFDPQDFERGAPGPGDDDRQRALDAIQGLSSSWTVPDTAISFGNIRWCPDLVAPDDQLLHLALTGDIPRALLRRLRAAQDEGHDLTVALGSHRVETSTLLDLQELDARIVAVNWDNDPGSACSYRSVADWIATERISLTPADLRLLAGARLDAALADSTHLKGRLYEEVLCLVFSQVSWLTVDEHAYYNASEEIDLVLGVHAIGQVAELAKGAVAIATAKNESKPTDSATVKYLKEQMANRKGRCNLGFLCSASTVSGAAKTEILRGSQSSDHVLVPLDLIDLRSLLDDAEHLDQRLQRLISAAVAA